MKAVVYYPKNKAEKLIYQDVPDPIAKEGEVLVRVRFTSLNAMDYRSMRLGLIPKSSIFGADISGVVASTGPGCKLLKPGDDVVGDIGAIGFGGLAEFVAVPERMLVVKSPHVSFEDAAALPVAAITALQALRDQGNVQPGQNVLIYGSGGGVGTFAVQLARYYGAHVTAVCGQSNCEIMHTLGADEVLDYSREDALLAKGKYDLILAVNGGRSLLAYERALTSKGRLIIVCGKMSQLIPALIFQGLLSLGGKKVKVLSTETNRDYRVQVMQLAEDQKIKPVIGRVYPLAQTAEAFAYLNEGHPRGKVLISIN